MARKQEFGIREGGLPGPEEISDEIRRTKEKRGAEPGEFLSVENIPNWLNDIGQKRDEDDPLVKTLEIFRSFPTEIQQDIVRQIEFEKNQKSLDDERLLERLTFLVEQNDDILKRDVGPYKVKPGGAAYSNFAAKKRPLPGNFETGTPSQEHKPMHPRNVPRDKQELKRLGLLTESHGKRGRKPELPKSLKERGRARKELQGAAERFQKDSER